MKDPILQISDLSKSLKYIKKIIQKIIQKNIQKIIQKISNISIGSSFCKTQPISRLTKAANLMISSPAQRPPLIW